MPSAPAAGYRTIPWWRPEGIQRLLFRPHRLAQAWGHVPVAVRIAPGDDGSDVTVWSYDPSRDGPCVHIDFPSPRTFRRLFRRWRVLADAIVAGAAEHPGRGFHDVRIDLNDGVAAAGADGVLAFARPIGATTRLIPNTYLLGHRRPAPAALDWARKSDTLYFRGTSTGDVSYETNTRVALCRMAREVPRADCKISRTKQVDGGFAARLQDDGLTAARAPLDDMNRHRFLVDADGNATSWDRFLWIGTFGGVPIRFEPSWEECWHHLLVDGVNSVTSTRGTLADTVAGLRDDDRRSRAIAARAAALARDHLSPPALRRMLVDTLRSAA